MAGEHISPDELAQMLENSAITSKDGFNRRYFHWLFKVSGNQLHDMRHLDMREVGSGDTWVFEEHDECHGAGCHNCGWFGEVIRWVSDRGIEVLQPSL